MDIAKRFHQNPLLKPSDLQPGIEGMEITCFLNPGVFRFDGKIWLLLRVAERPVQKQGVISFPVYNKERKIEVLSFDENDPKLDASDPRVIGYAGQNYLTTMSYLRLVSSEDGIHFKEEPDYPPIFGQGALEAFGIEDCRVATTADGYYLTFTEVSSVAVGVGLIHTRDWKNYTRHGMIFPPHNKDCALFEETINGKYLPCIVRVVPNWVATISGLPNPPTACIGATTVVLRPPVPIVGIVPVWAQVPRLSVQRKDGWRFIMVQIIRTAIAWEPFCLI